MSSGAGATDSLNVVRRFERAWRTADLQAVYALMTDDIFYHNMPREPILGLEAVKRYVDAYVDRFGRLLSVDWDVKSIAVNGNMVFIERVSRLSWENGHRTACPIVGVFEVRDGKIAAWRDYFDRATFDT